MANLSERPDSPEANALVERLKAEVIAIFHELGAIHLQVARTYPLKQSHQPEGWAILETLKRQVDPRGLMNPGSLAL
jgi:FAD/FMN-containing dehydrogenase